MAVAREGLELLGWNAAHLSAYDGDAAGMERALLQGDAGCVNARAADGKTPLHLAVLMRSRDERGGGDGDDSPILRLLLDAGADTNAQDETGRAALHMCCGDAKNGSALASLLLREGADLSSDKQGAAPF